MAELADTDPDFIDSLCEQVARIYADRLAGRLVLREEHEAALDETRELLSELDDPRDASRRVVISDAISQINYLLADRDTVAKTPAHAEAEGAVAAEPESASSTETEEAVAYGQVTPIEGAAEAGTTESDPAVDTAPTSPVVGPAPVVGPEPEVDPAPVGGFGRPFVVEQMDAPVVEAAVEDVVDTAPVEQVKVVDPEVEASGSERSAAIAEPVTSVGPESKLSEPFVIESAGIDSAGIDSAGLAAVDVEEPVLAGPAESDASAPPGPVPSSTSRPVKAARILAAVSVVLLLAAGGLGYLTNQSRHSASKWKSLDQAQAVITKQVTAQLQMADANIATLSSEINTLEAKIAAQPVPRAGTQKTKPTAQQTALKELAAEAGDVAQDLQECVTSGNTLTQGLDNALADQSLAGAEKLEPSAASVGRSCTLAEQASQSLQTAIQTAS